jgi:hypothetical protein
MTSYWKAFLNDHRLAGSEFAWKEKVDDFEFERQIRLLSEEESRQEAEDAYPGIIVSRDGFHAVADDLSPSGDPYFINDGDGVGGPLYKIYHESVADEGYRREDAVVVALSDYRDLLKHKRA